MGVFFPNPLPQQEISKIVSRKLAWILEACQPKAVVLFGSAAKGRMTDRSDVDLALIFQDENQLRLGRSAIFRRPPPDSLPQDLLFFTAAAFQTRAAIGGVCEIIKSEGTTLYGVMP